MTACTLSSQDFITSYISKRRLIPTFTTIRLTRLYSASTMQLPTQTLPSSAPPPTFPLFPTLPTELRLKIWSFFLSITLPTPITISIPVNGQVHRWVADDSILRKGCPIPAILHVCQEAREVGLGKYVMGYELEGGLSELPFNHCWRRVEDGET
jgi:hypothetical protein